MKYRSICSVASKSAITPSWSGRIAVMWSGVRPIIRLASWPTARISPVASLRATTLGSSTSTPLPRTYTSVFAVPRSTAMSRPMKLFAITSPCCRWGRSDNRLRRHGAAPGEDTRPHLRIHVTPLPTRRECRRQHRRLGANADSAPAFAPTRALSDLHSRRLGDRSELGEPDPDLAGGRLLGVGAVHEVLLDGQAPVAAEVAADGARGGDGGVGGAGEGAEALDAALALDHDGEHGAGQHELD